MQTAVFLSSVIIAFLVSFILGYIVIPWLRKLKFGQTILEIGPKWHKSKEGTPTMGGILIFAGVVAGIIAAVAVDGVGGGHYISDDLSSPLKLTTFLAGIGLALGMGMIGFLDDYIKVVKKRNLGLTARQKTMLQFLVAAAYLASLALGGMDTTWIPFVGDVPIMSSYGLIFWPVALFFVYGFTNAVNLTDGIDGLDATVTMVVACAFMIMSSGGMLDFFGVNIVSSALAGACMGFLIWNTNPAKVFMGDTGSLFLGGAVVALSFGIGRPILLLLAGAIYLIEALSVMIQVTVYKKTKKRVFKMAPIHHHFEMSGWNEGKIVVAFSLVTLIGCALAVFLSVQ